MVHPQVLNSSVGKSIHPIFIRSTRRFCLHPQIRVGRRIVPVSLSQPAVICLLEIRKMKSSNSIQENNDLRKKMVEHTITCLSTNYCIPFWRSSLYTCFSIKSSIELGSSPRIVACKKINVAS
jgi:hypothetical protein